MTSFGFSNHSINWFESYLSGRIFRVNIPNKYYSIAETDCRVTQGTCLRTFIIFTVCQRYESGNRL